jgi:hypothetical protein
MSVSPALSDVFKVEIPIVGGSHHAPCQPKAIIQIGALDAWFGKWHLGSIERRPEL